MSGRIHQNVTIAVRDERAKRSMEEYVRSEKGLELRDPGAGEMGLLVYEVSDDPARDLARIHKALAGGMADAVFLTCVEPSPQLLIDAMRAGVREFLPITAGREEFLDALHGAMDSAPRKAAEAIPESRGRIIPVIGTKGGVGATTVAVNLAMELSLADPGNVVLMDLREPLGEVPLFLDLEYSYTLGDLIDNVARLDATYVRSVMARHALGLDVLPSPGVYRGESGLGVAGMDVILRHMSGIYGTVITDDDAVLDDATIQELERADTVVLVMVLSLPCLAHVRRFLERVRPMGHGLAEKVKLAVNRYAKDSDIEVGEAEDILQHKISWLIPNDYPTTLAAINQGKCLREFAPKSAVTRTIARMARDLGAAPAAEGADKRSLLGLFRRKGGDLQPQGATS